MHRIARRSTIIAAFVGIAFSATWAAEAPGARDLSVDQRPYVDIMPSTSGPMKVEAWVDHRSGVYRVGSTLRLSVRPSNDAYITVLDIGSSGRATVLFPNRRSRENYVRGGETLELPDGGWAIGVHGPTGADLIMVFASTSRLPIFHGHVTESDIYEMLDSNPRDVTRDLAVVLNSDHKKKWAGTWRVIRIKPARSDDDGD